MMKAQKRSGKRQIVQAGYHLNGLNGDRAVARRRRQRLAREAKLLAFLERNSPFSSAAA